jgi:hypothetical protein
LLYPPELRGTMCFQGMRGGVFRGSGASVHIGVQLADRLMQILIVDRMVPLDR